ncbi:hypothetical protein BJ165DRAFT_1464674, partial [Panaeolus papilionaceus]
SRTRTQDVTHKAKSRILSHFVTHSSNPQHLDPPPFHLFYSISLFYVPFVCFICFFSAFPCRFLFTSYSFHV